MFSFNKVNVTANTEDFQDLDQLLLIMLDKKFVKGTTIYCEGDMLCHLYYIKEGSVKFSKVSDDGSNFVLQHFYKGDLFGEYDGTKAHKASFRAEATSDCKIGMIRFDELIELLSKTGDFVFDFSKWLSHMQWFTQLKFRDVLMHGKNGALASILIRASKTYGVQMDDCIVIPKRITNSELAEMIGATRETVNRILGQFQKEKWIEMNDGLITIEDLETLKQICQCEDCPDRICRL